jgi:hypothetical protein
MRTWDQGAEFRRLFDLNTLISLIRRSGSGENSASALRRVREHMAIGPEPAPKSEITPPPRFLPPVVHKVSDLNAPGPKVSSGCEIGCEGDNEQLAWVSLKDAARDAEAVAPRTRFAGSAVAAAIGGAVRLHQLFIARFMLA